ncbi:MAG TPA: hypothetical protein DCR62_03870 [Acholeplasmatales bacterium]|jgi:membrane protein|nr:hypothetical protein [Bacilli bacterium]HAR57862.1 hypothetical protein [Acholeplasmatales bacterium]
MHNYKKSFIGAYYIIVGAIFAFIVWPFGKELIDIIVKMLGIILIIIGGFSLFIYNHTKKVGTFVNMTFLYDGIFKILFGLAILFIPIGLISFILGIVFLIYTVIIAIMEKNLLDLFGKSLYKLMIAFMLIFCGIENIGIWILRVIDIVIILYGFILLIVASKENSKMDGTSKDDKLIDVEFEESKDEE